MAKYTSADVPFVILNGIDIRGLTPTLEDAGIEGDFEDITPLGSGFRANQYAGSGTGKVSLDTFYDDTQTSPYGTEYALKTAQWMATGPDRYLTYGHSGNTNGRDFVGTTVKQATYNRVLEVGKFTRARADFVVNERRDGKLVGKLESHGAAGNTTYMDYGADPPESSAVMWAMLTGASGSWTNVTINWQTDPASGGTYTTRLTTSTIAYANVPLTVRIAGTGLTIDRYWRVSWTYTGGSTPTWTGAVGVAIY